MVMARDVPIFHHHHCMWWPFYSIADDKKRVTHSVDQPIRLWHLMVYAEVRSMRQKASNGGKNSFDLLLHRSL